MPCLLVLLGLLDVIDIADGLDLAFGDLAVLVDARVVDAVDPALIQENEEDDVIAEAREAVQPGHADTEGCSSVAEHCREFA